MERSSDRFAEPASIDTLAGTMSSNSRLAVFPGQFDPITRGHLDIIRRGAKLFDELIVAVGANPDKRELFTIDERVQMISELLIDLPNVSCQKFSGLTANFVKSTGATAILRGIRDVSDLRYEFQLALANRAVGNVETVFIMTGDQYALTSSSLIRQVVMLGGDANQLAPLVPDSVVSRLIRLQATLPPALADTPPN
ncbi:MAG TPA: pantetheine-phosphate adenylyltransferase [Tepidisphaeraceae bacterium]|nr:pantetheine-phosphate adenylyltransferase [Tepidisphaeraceae bacterium]